MEYLTTQMKEMSKKDFDLMTRISNISIILNENWILQRGVDVYSDSCSSYQGNRDEESLLTVWIVYKSTIDSGATSKCDGFCHGSSSKPIQRTHGIWSTISSKDVHISCGYANAIRIQFDSLFGKYHLSFGR